MKPSSAALVTPNIGLQKSITSKLTSHQLGGQDGTFSPPYFPSSCSLISSASSRHDDYQQQDGGQVGSSPFVFQPYSMLLAMSFSTAPPSRFRPTMMPCGPKKNPHRSAPSMTVDTNKDSRYSNHSGYQINTDIPIVMNAPIKKRKFHPVVSGANPKPHNSKKLKMKKKFVPPKKQVSSPSTCTVTVKTTPPLPKKGIEIVKTDTNNGCSSAKKFSWKRYPRKFKWSIV